MSLEELTKNFKPVKNEDTSIFKEYYPSFFKARKYPRFYQSLMEMSQYVNVPTYFWKEINNCLVVLHKRWIHQPVMYLALPPISKNGRIEDELKVIQTFKDFCAPKSLENMRKRIMTMAGQDKELPKGFNLLNKKSVKSSLFLYDIGYEYTQREKCECPFPSNEFYDRKAWKWLLDNYEKLKAPILFWNIGSDFNL